MIIYFHLWLTCAVAVVYWAKIYITLQKKRQNPSERKIDLIINSILAVLFTFAFLDIFLTLPEIAKILSLIKQLSNW